MNANKTKINSLSTNNQSTPTKTILSQALLLLIYYSISQHQNSGKINNQKKMSRRRHHKNPDNINLLVTQKWLRKLNRLHNKIQIKTSNWKDSNRRLEKQEHIMKVIEKPSRMRKVNMYSKFRLGTLVINRTVRKMKN